MSSFESSSLNQNELNLFNIDDQYNFMKNTSLKNSYFVDFHNDNLGSEKSYYEKEIHNIRNVINDLENQLDLSSYRIEKYERQNNKSLDQRPATNLSNYYQVKEISIQEQNNQKQNINKSIQNQSKQSSNYQSENHLNSVNNSKSSKSQQNGQQKQRLSSQNSQKSLNKDKSSVQDVNNSQNNKNSSYQQQKVISNDNQSQKSQQSLQQRDPFKVANIKQQQLERQGEIQVNMRKSSLNKTQNSASKNNNKQSYLQNNESVINQTCQTQQNDNNILERNDILKTVYSKACEKIEKTENAHLKKNNSSKNNLQEIQNNEFQNNIQFQKQNNNNNFTEISEIDPYKENLYDRDTEIEGEFNHFSQRKQVEHFCIDNYSFDSDDQQRKIKSQTIICQECKFLLSRGLSCQYCQFHGHTKEKLYTKNSDHKLRQTRKYI